MSRLWLVFIFTITSSKIVTQGNSESCIKELSHPYGVITSPYYPFSYQTNLDCVWTIKAKTGHLIEISFKRFDVETAYWDDQCHDYVNIYDGQSESSLSLSTLCGWKSELTFRSSSNVLSLAFHSDESNIRPGFLAVYRTLYCPPFYFGREDCNTSCNCVRDNSLFCDSTNGTCYCKEGYRGDHCEIDVDECLELPNLCIDVDYQRCVDTPGGYECSCQEGLTLNGDGHCKSAGSCKEKNCSHECGRLPVSPNAEMCYCPNGMKLNSTNDQQCVACANGTYGRNCNFTCQCSTDTAQTRACDPSTGDCYCLPGWTSSTCSEDVNECNLLLNPCPEHSYCINTMGSYYCQCYSGYEETANKTCVRSGEDCSFSLKNMTGELIPTHMYYYNNINCSWLITVPSGYRIFLDFSKLFLHCEWEKVKVFDGSDTQAILYGQYCTYPVPTITSSGPSLFVLFESLGWYWSNRFKAIYVALENDVIQSNQSLRTEGCNSTFTNESGVFASPNYPGKYNNNVDCFWLITVNKGFSISLYFDTLETECLYDYVTIYDGSNISSPLIGQYCSSHHKAVFSTQNAMYISFTSDESETRLGFKAYYLSKTECPHLMYSEDCSLTCHCVQNNTEFCTRSSGQCVCKSGWTSPTCSLDINECLLNPCPLYSRCTNVDGSYVCQCYDGLILNSNGICEVENKYSCKEKNCSHMCAVNGSSVETCYCPVGSKLVGNICQDCQKWSFGENCQYDCDCITNHASNCDPINGTCNCLPGWTSKYCSEDLNECLQTHCGPYTRCVNVPGNYSCQCIEGYTRNLEGTCAPIECNEILTSDSGIITSPLYPDNYYRYANCSWLITVKEGFLIAINFTVLQISCNQDMLTLIDGNVRHEICWEDHYVFLSSSNSLYITFTSSNQYTNKGFMASYNMTDCQLVSSSDQEFYAISNNIAVNCSLLVTVKEGYRVFLPWYYYFGIFDHIAVYDGNSTSATILRNSTLLMTDIFSSSNTMFITFTLESTNRSSDVVHLYYFSRKVYLEKLTNSSGIIESFSCVNHSDLYENGILCQWLIQAPQNHIITFRLLTFNLYFSWKCEYNLMSLHDGNNTLSMPIGIYCGDDVPALIRGSVDSMLISYFGNSREKGFFGSYDSHLCNEFKYGYTCEHDCKCVRNNTDFCDNVKGICVCKSGWMGSDCSVDVDECLDTEECQINSDCINTPGSFVCHCKDGYVEVSNGTCEVNSNCHEKNCSHSCYITASGVEQCVCPDGLILENVHNLTCVVPYYPYGHSALDTVLRTGEHASLITDIIVSKTIHYTSGVPVGKEHSEKFAYVYSNGVIQLGGGIIPGIPSLGYAADKRVNLIAPYWAIMDPRKGKVYYQLYESCDPQTFGMNDFSPPPYKDDVMERATKDVIKFANFSNFDVSNVLVVTWEDMQPYSLSNKSTEKNTFQAVFISGNKKEIINGLEKISDEANSFVIFLYQSGLMNWKYIPGRMVSIGQVTDGQAYDTDLGKNETVEKLDRIKGQTGYNGMLMYHVGKYNGPEEKCHRYVCQHFNLLFNRQYLTDINQLFKCPCTLDRLGLQWNLYEIRGVDQDVYCFAISAIAKIRLLRGNLRNKLCCYKWTQPKDQGWEAYLLSRRQASYIPASGNAGHILIADPWHSWWNHHPVSYSLAMENLQAHDYCCRNSSIISLCQQFYQVFPDMGCSHQVTFVPASALGDPHITTLDGKTYPMNGWGEYILLEVPEENFTLQARTGRAETINGTLTNATVFIAFVAKENSSSTFQVEIASDGTTMSIFINNQNVTSEFYSQSNYSHIENLNIRKDNTLNITKVIATFLCGISVKVSVGLRSLKLDLEVDKSLQTKTKGLLGNFNGDTSDEFSLMNGTILHPNVSEREILQVFAESYEVTEQSSAFVYRNGETFRDYQHPDFVPMFRDEMDPRDLEQAVEFCGGDNDACIFDYVATGDRNFAFNTKQSRKELEETILTLSNNPPTLCLAHDTNSTGFRWLVFEDVPNIIQVMASDEDEDSITIEILENLTDISINQNGTVSYKPNLKNLSSVGLRARDSKGGYSSLLYIPLTVCPKCSNHGKCSETMTRDDQVHNQFVEILTCDCPPAYSGLNCESEFNACEYHPCSVGQNCTDITAAEQGNNSVGYLCGPCPVGFVDLSGRCVDEDECAIGKVCEKNCQNTEGSFICSCNHGYTLQSGHKCVAVEGLTVNVLSKFNYTADLTEVNTVTVLKERFMKELLNRFQESMPAVINVIVKTLKAGSLKVEYDVVVSKYLQDPVTNLAVVIVRLMSRPLSVNGESVSWIESYVNKQKVSVEFDICVFKQMFEPCSENEYCEIQRGQAKCLSSKTNEDLILGLGIGIPSFVILCAVVVALVCYWKKKKIAYRKALDLRELQDTSSCLQEKNRLKWTSQTQVSHSNAGPPLKNQEGGNYNRGFIPVEEFN